MKINQNYSKEFDVCLGRCDYICILELNTPIIRTEAESSSIKISGLETEFESMTYLFLTNNITARKNHTLI